MDRLSFPPEPQRPPNVPADPGGAADRFAMNVKVDCYAGYRGEETPRRIEIDGRRVEVVEVIDRWHGPDHRYFKLRGDDGAAYVLRHDESAECWALERLDSAS